MLGFAFYGITAGLLLGSTSTALLISLLGIGGLGYGAVFSGTLGQLTDAVTDQHAPDISGLFNTAIKVGGWSVSQSSEFFTLDSPHTVGTAPQWQLSQ